jgi:hypothetical protein
MPFGEQKTVSLRMAGVLRIHPQDVRVQMRHDVCYGETAPGVAPS